jgi:hypothetical protein
LIDRVEIDTAAHSTAGREVERTGFVEVEALDAAADRRARRIRRWLGAVDEVPAARAPGASPTRPENMTTLPPIMPEILTGPSSATRFPRTAPATVTGPSSTTSHRSSGAVGGRRPARSTATATAMLMAPPPPDIRAAP